MSGHPEFAAAAAGARKIADRQGLVISWMRWHNGELQWQGIPKKAAKAAAQGEGAFEPRTKRGVSQGQLL